MLGQTTGKPIKTNKMETNYYISAGQGVKMFTLRIKGFNYNSQGAKYPTDQHVQSLSIDIEKAIKKAEQITGFTLPAPDINLDEIKRDEAANYTPDQVRTGYNKGESVCLLESWVIWKYILTKYNMKNKKFRAALVNELLERAEISDEDAAVVRVGGLRAKDGSFFKPRNLNDKLKQAIRQIKQFARQIEFEAKKALSNYVGTIGERLELELTLAFQTSGCGYYGTWYLYTFNDSDGNKIAYLGSSSIDIEKGEKVTIKGTVKEHTEYKGEKQTKLQRIKIV